MSAFLSQCSKLQWGHGVEPVEMRHGLRNQGRHGLRFNGATGLNPWRFFKQWGEWSPARGFNGATGLNPWRSEFAPALVTGPGYASMGPRG